MTRPITPSFARYGDLEGRNVFVSGGASGIGRAITTLFAQQGARIVFVDIDRAAGEALAEAIHTQYGYRPVFLPCDVTDDAALSQAIARAAGQEKTLSVLVNNAARDLRVPMGDVTPAIWDELVAVNLRHQFFATQAARPFLQAAGGGSVINFGSIAPTQGILGLSVYNACKAAVFGLTRTLARELGPDNIRVNSVVPGAILTPRQLRDWISDADRKALIERQCLKREMVEEDVAEMVLFLASAVSRGCTGQEFRVDGGNF